MLRKIFVYSVFVVQYSIFISGGWLCQQAFCLWIITPICQILFWDQANKKSHDSSLTTFFYKNGKIIFLFSLIPHFLLLMSLAVYILNFNQTPRNHLHFETEIKTKLVEMLMYVNVHQPQSDQFKSKKKSWSRKWSSIFSFNTKVVGSLNRTWEIHLMINTKRAKITFKTL